MCMSADIPDPVSPPPAITAPELDDVKEVKTQEKPVNPEDQLPNKKRAGKKRLQIPLANKNSKSKTSGLGY